MERLEEACRALRLPVLILSARCVFSPPPGKIPQLQQPLPLLPPTEWRFNCSFGPFQLCEVNLCVPVECRSPSWHVVPSFQTLCDTLPSQHGSLAADALLSIKAYRNPLSACHIAALRACEGEGLLAKYCTVPCQHTHTHDWKSLWAVFFFFVIALWLSKQFSLSQHLDQLNTEKKKKKKKT